MLAEVVPRWASVGQRCFIVGVVAACFMSALGGLHQVVQSAVSRVAFTLSVAISLAVYVSFSACAVRALTLTADAAMLLAADETGSAALTHEVVNLRKAAAWTRWTAVATAGACGTTMALGSGVILGEMLYSVGQVRAGLLLTCATSGLDTLVNSLAVGMLSGFWGPKAARRTSLALRFTAQEDLG